MKALNFPYLRAPLLRQLAWTSLAVASAACGATAASPATDAGAHTDVAVAGDAVADAADVAGGDIASDVADIAADLTSTGDAAAEIATGCVATPCQAPQVCQADGSCCTPNCQDKCNAMPDGCGGFCNNECINLCQMPTSAPAILYRAWSFKPLADQGPSTGCPTNGPLSDGTHVTDFAKTTTWSAGDQVAIGFAADGLIGVAQELDLIAGGAGGANCSVGMQGCGLKVWASSFSPYGLPDQPCPGRALLQRDDSQAQTTFRQAEKNPVPSAVPLFLFAGTADALTPWVRVHNVMAQPSTNTAKGGLFCGVVRKDDLQQALTKVGGSVSDTSLVQLQQWMKDTEPSMDQDGDGTAESWPFAFSLGISTAGPSLIVK